MATSTSSSSSSSSSPLLTDSTSSANPNQISRSLLPLRLWFLFYFAAEAATPFLSLFFHSVSKFSFPTIGFLLASRRFVALLCAPIFTYLCDLTHRHRFILLSSLTLYYIFCYFLTIPKTFFVAFIVLIIRDAFVSGADAIANIATILKLDQLKLNRDEYGRQRLYGAIGWGSAALLSMVFVQYVAKGDMRWILYMQCLWGIGVIWIAANMLDLEQSLFEEGGDGVGKKEEMGMVVEEGIGMGMVVGGGCDGGVGHEVDVVKSLEGGRRGGGFLRKDGSWAELSDSAFSVVTPPLSEMKGGEEEEEKKKKGCGEVSSNVWGARILQDYQQDKDKYGVKDPLSAGVDVGTQVDFASPSTSFCTDDVSPRSGEFEAEKFDSNTKFGRSPSGVFFEMLHDPHILSFCANIITNGLVVGIMQSALFLYMKSLGVPVAMFGFSIFLNCIMEAPAFYYSDRISRFMKGSLNMLYLALSFSVVSLLFFGSLHLADGNVKILLFFFLSGELVRGMVYALYWSAAVTHMAQVSPKEFETTAQGTLSAMHWGIGCALGSIMGGSMLELLGGKLLFRLAAGFQAVVLVGPILIQRLFARRRLYYEII